MPTVGDLMSRELVKVEASASVEDAAKRMVGRRAGSALVFEGDRLAGIVTERDVLRIVAAGALAETIVRDCMSHHPETVEPSESVEQAGVLMLHGGFRHLPVVEGSEVVGVISMRDLVGHVLSDSAPRGA